MKIVQKIQDFIADSRAVGIVLLGCTALSLALANTGGRGWLALWQWRTGRAAGLPGTVTEWLNDAGMAVFFCLAGMEIKRELTQGELSSFRRAILPAAAAVGGMALPALIFLAVTWGTGFTHGWGIPMATDIAFSLGVASLLGTRMPVGLKVFLTALAIIDDLGAIITIAVFYSHGLQVYYLLAGLAVWGLVLAARRWGWVQVALGLVMWYCFFNSGVHATVAGVLFAFAVPQRRLREWEHALRIPVNFVILPLFALANTAVTLPGTGAVLAEPIGAAVLSGLLIGKTLGITGAVFLLVRLKVAVLPSGSNWRQMLGTGMLGAIGFTMSIFITLLAYDRPGDQDAAKFAVLAASLIAMGAALAWFRWATGGPKAAGGGSRAAKVR